MSGMDIVVTYGVGTGDTSVAAFYAALKDAGLHPYNFLDDVPLIPAGAIVRLLEDDERAEVTKRGKWANLAYLALAKSFGKDLGREYLAGLGWSQDKDGSGFFLRYPGIDPVNLYSEKSVEELIEKGVNSIVKADREMEIGEIKKKIVSIKCEDKPVSALVCALFKVLPFE